jgi:hypothetical protein
VVPELVLVLLVLPEVLVVGCQFLLPCPLLEASPVKVVSYTSSLYPQDLHTNIFYQSLLLPLLLQLFLPLLLWSLLLSLEPPSSPLLRLLSLLLLPLRSPLWSLLPLPLPASKDVKHGDLNELTSFFVLVH